MLTLPPLSSSIVAIISVFCRWSCLQRMNALYNTALKQVQSIRTDLDVFSTTLSRSSSTNAPSNSHTALQGKLALLDQNWRLTMPRSDSGILDRALADYRGI